MGCGNIKKPENSVWLNAFTQKFRYRVKVGRPNKDLIEFIYEDQFDEMPLTTLMNLLSFSEKDLNQFDANFVSIRNKEDDNFTYYIQRLVGIERNEEKGMDWVVYLNKKLYSWNDIVQMNIKVKPEDHLVCSFQNEANIS
jgi:hypothetical protein